jgi:hypothetical protein
MADGTSPHVPIPSSKRVVVCDNTPLTTFNNSSDNFRFTVASPPPPARAAPTSPEMNGTTSKPYSNGIPSTDKDTASQKPLANIVRRKLTGYVGFANLPNQWHRKSVRKGFHFNVMVVGMYFFPLYPVFVVSFEVGSRLIFRGIGIGKVDVGEYFV